jgi:hypothetical protein
MLVTISLAAHGLGITVLSHILDVDVFRHAIEL